MFSVACVEDPLSEGVLAGSLHMDFGTALTKTCCECYYWNFKNVLGPFALCCEHLPVLLRIAPWNRNSPG